jgi:hypothetical protein
MPTSSLMHLVSILGFMIDPGAVRLHNHAWMTEGSACSVFNLELPFSGATSKHSESTLIPVSIASNASLKIII